MVYFFQCACLGKHLVTQETLEGEVGKNPEALATMRERILGGDICEVVLEFGDHCPDCAPGEEYKFKIVVHSINDVPEC